MANRYTDELAEWVKKREATRPRQDKSLVAFLAVKEDIREAIDAGYALKTIWAHMNETSKIPYRYETFLKHVHKHIKDKSGSLPSTKGQVIVEKPSSLGASKPAQPEPKKNPVIKSAGFSFDAKPNKEELL